MEISEGRRLIDLNLRKIFDMKMKQGHEMRKAFVDETEFLRTFYFLKGSRVYEIEISSKKLEELEFTKGKEVVYLSSNANNEYLIIINKDGKIYAIDNQHNVKYVKNFLATSLLMDKTKEINFNSLKLAASPKLDKIVLANESVMAIWYQNDIVPNSNIKFFKKSQMQELTGTFYNISLENEKKVYLPPEVFASKSYSECIAPVFSNNYFLGSYGRISYLLLYYEVTSYKVVLIDYLFKYDTVHKLRAIDFNSPSTYDDHLIPEYLKSIEKKVMYTYLHHTKESLNLFNNKERIIMKYNKQGNVCAILINFNSPNNTTLILFMSETSRFVSTNIYNMVAKLKYPLIKDEKSPIMVEDIEWICNDLFIVILLSGGYFAIINTNFQLIHFMDSSNNSCSPSNNDDILIPNYYTTMKLKISDKLNLITSKKRTDYFLIYSTNYSICYQVNFKNFENKIFTNNFHFSFEDFLYEFKYFQIYNNPHDVESSALFDKIHNYFVKCLKDLYDPTALTTVVNDSVNSLFNTFVKFLRIFRQINQVHETNLTVLSYLIGISNDFFIHLLNCKEIWLGFLFLNICENYLLKHIKIKSRGNKLCSDSLKKGQITYLIVNPYYQPNISLKCFNKVRNRVIHSRLRLLLIFFALIEFRNNQALNINVLYFILAKLAMEKMKKHNLLDDIQMIVKVIIRNWKFLKNENTRAGCEEYILNGLSMNYRTELLAPFIHTRSVRDDIKFDFFNDFYPLEELHTFTELNEIYCRGEEETLINEYSYINNVGVVQKWILYYTNFFYVYLFDDIKTYIENQLRQYSNKNPEIISPDEKNLACIIYFNLNLFFMCITNQLEFFLKFMSNKTDQINDLYISADNPRIMEEFVKTYVPFVSPVDVPFLIFEFYISEDNKAKKKLTV